MDRVEPVPPGLQARGWSQRWRDWRNRRVADPAFQRWAASFAPTRPFARRHAGAVFDLMAGFVYSQVLLACVRLGVFDALAEGALPIANLGHRIGLGAEGTARLVAAAGAIDLLELRGDSVALGRLGAPLTGNAALAAMVEHHATLYADLSDPVALLRREGRPAMAGYWPYAGGNATPAALTPEQVANYSALMSASQPLVTEQVLQAYDFRRHRVLLDVGSGEGGFAAAVARAAPALRLHLFDLPAVAERAKARLTAEGLAGRCSVHGGDFFTDPLPAGADIVSLVRVAFDHSDEAVSALLRAVRRALPDDGTLLVAEPMAEAPGARAMGAAYFGFYLLAMGRGQARSAARLTALLHGAGFGSVQAVPTHLPVQTGLLVARGRLA